jgi:hypothetical protein
VSTALVLQLLGSAVVASVIGAVINGILNRKKLGAEATEIITKAASGVVRDIREDNERLRRRVSELEIQASEWMIEKQEWKDVLILHGAWDLMATTAVNQAIPPIELPPPPPLTPPVRVRVSRDYGHGI